MASANGKIAPADFPPPVDLQKEFVKRSLDCEDERIEIAGCDDREARPAAP